MILQNKIFKVWPFLVALLCATTVASAQEQLSPADEDLFFKQLESTLGQLKSMANPFVQTRHVDLFSEDMQAQGVTIFVAPDQIRHEITAPFRTVIISGPAGMARFERPSNGDNWKKLSGSAVSAMGQVTAQIAQWLRGQVRTSNKQYELSVFRMADGYQVKMVPRNKNMRQNISWIELRLPTDCRRVSTVTMHEAGGDYTKIDYSAFAPINQPLPAGLFDISQMAPSPLPNW